MANALRQRWRRACGLLFAASVAGCGDTAPSGPSYGIEDVLAAFTPEIAALLDANGALPLEQEATGELTQARAIEFAVIHWRTRHDLGMEERKAERPEGYERELESCGRAFYARTAYEGSIDDELDEYYHRVFASHWIVPLCHRGQQQAVVGISTRATYLEVDEYGYLRGAMEAHHWTAGVRDGASLPIAPEAGAVAIFRALGVRVSGVPVFRQRPGFRGEEFIGGVWLYQLEHPVVIKGRESDYPREVSQLGIGYERRYSYSYDELVSWNGPYIVAASPWYSNAWQPRLPHLHNRADVPAHYEIVRRIPR